MIPKEFWSGDDKTFTQDEVNSFNKKERERREVAEAKLTKQQEAIDTLTAQVGELGKTASMSDEERADLLQKVEDAKNEGLTELQQLQKKTNELTEKNTRLEETGAKALATITNQLHNQIINSEIMDAVTKNAEHLAHNPQHIIALVKGSVSIDPETMKPIVKGYEVKDEEGNIEHKDLPVVDVIKLMSQVEEHKTLFKPVEKTGLGGSGSTGDPLKMPKTIGEYRDSPARKVEQGIK